MKLSFFRFALAALAGGLCTGQLSAEQPAFAEISLAVAGGHSIQKTEYLALVVEGPTLSFESAVIPNASVVAYVNELLAKKNVSYIGVYAREGTKYGELVRAVDLLRGTNAKSIGISISELPPGKEP